MKTFTLLADEPTGILWHLQVFFIYIIWFWTLPVETKKTWSKCYHSMIKHTCEYENKLRPNQSTYKCKHHGCNSISYNKGQ